jgi:phytoene dehydrogenase-like protein
MPMPSSDILVLGGGTNGLACATRLAQAGRKVTLIEAGADCGGGALGWEFAPGFRTPGLAHVLHMLDPRVARAMGLVRLGLTLGPGLATLVHGAGGAMDPETDPEWKALQHKLGRYATALAPIREQVPPRLARKAGNDLLALAKTGLGLRRLGADDFREFLRLFLINVWDVAEDDLTDPRLRGLLCFDATLGAWAGPRSPNTLALYLNRLAGMGALHLPSGGMDAVASAMALSATESGVTIRTDTRVARILVQEDRAIGVETATGERIDAGTVISALNPKTTLLDLLGHRHLDTGMATALRAQKSRGAAARLNLALTTLPDGIDARARHVIAPSGDAVESAFNSVKYGEVPVAPVMEVLFPSAHGPSYTPDTKATLSAIVQFAPHDPKDRDAARQALLDRSLALLDASFPGLGAQVIHAEMLMPYDIETRFGMGGGNWHHGELSVEQMYFLRPLPALAQYRAPIGGLWLAGAGSHPGGGISGAAGWNAAGAVLKGGDK